jgi:hypothetical protein
MTNVQKKRGGGFPPAPGEGEQKEASSLPAAPDSQKSLDALNDAITKTKAEIKKRTRYIEVCHCGDRNCRIGPFNTIAVED